ncbi:MAG: hypothetical protein DHS20C18_47190 [Saprospiraceae bacterium]|nr:MAG: hypothetical protein DHS20C18_47190 [Saprospiraceae bacterium]
MSDFNPDRIEPKSEGALKVYADTSQMLARIAGFSGPRQQVDSLIYYAEWLKNYQEDIALYYAQKAYDLATEKNWTLPRAISANRMAWSKGKKARFGEDIEDAMVDARISKRLLGQYDHSFWQVDINNLFGFLFRLDNQMDSARYYFEAALTSINNLETKEKVIIRNKVMILHNLATTYPMQDSLKHVYYYQQSDSLFQLLGNKENRARLWRDWALFYQWHKKYEKADSLYNLCLDYGNQYKDVNILALTYQAKGSLYNRMFRVFEKEGYFTKAIQNLRKCLEYEHDYQYRTYKFLGSTFQDSWAIDIDESHADSAILYYNLAILKAREVGAIRSMKNLSKDLAALCNYLGDRCKHSLGEGIETFLDKNYTAVVDTITNHNKIAFQRINKSEQRDLQVNATNKRRNQLWIGLAILFVTASIFIFAVQRQQTRRLKAEMEALRAQINPHFMSNSLNAIEGLVNTGNTKAAAKYLVHFSRLTRQILNGSRSATTSLANELKTLEHFLALEQLRFRDKLTFEIQLAPEVMADQVQVPAMVLQPYVENAILHGIKPKAEGGHVHISAHTEGKILVCSIEDNGIGRDKSRALKKASVFQHKSMGMQITEERLKAMGRIKGSQISIQDLKDDSGIANGTKVTIRLPYRLKKNFIPKTLK